MKRIKMKNSLSRQMTMVFVCLLAFVLCVLFIVNARFLSRYYISHKQQDLVNTYEEIVDAQKNGTLSDEETQKKLQYGLEKTNIDVYAMYADADKNVVITNVKEGGLLYKQMLRIFFSKDDDMAEKSVLLKTDDYVICKMTDTQSNTQYLEMWGYLDDDGFVTMRSPLESIRDSAILANQFLIYMGLIGMIVGGILVWFFSRRITRPVMELAQLSEDMANLNFEARYTSGGKNEIGILGENFNKMSSQLEKTVSELKTANNELQKDIEKKEEIDEMRKEFLSNVSHELKTPIALIQGYAEGLQDNINDDEESRQFYCDVIIDEAGKMNQMVKKLLTLNQLEFGNDQVNMERFDLTSLIQGVIQSSQILAQQAEVEIMFYQTEPLHVWGDEFKVEEVITNYVTNAIHYAKNEKKIDIRCTQENGVIRTSVFNTGDAIPEEELDKIWIKFYKVDKARTREYGGSGIGLSIVKAIMESMNQQCGVKNYDNGVEFWFTLDTTLSGNQE